MPDISVAIIDPFHPAIVDMIAAALPPGWALRVAKGKTPADRRDAFREADTAFVMAAPVTTELIESAPRLGFIQKLGAGVDRIDLDLCKARGIGVARLFAGNAVPVAEHTVMLMLACYRRLILLDRQTRAGGWDKELSRGVNRQISGKVVGILGFGAVGRQLARVLAGFGVEILYYDPFRAPETVEAELDARYAELDEVVQRADILSLHLPLTKDTAGLLNAARIASMKRGAVVINCARGGLIDDAALARALTDGHLLAAGLDAFSEEPPVGNPLLALDEKTVITPHIAGATLDNFASVAERAVGNARLWLEGKPLPAADVVLAPRSRAAVG